MKKIGGKIKIIGKPRAVDSQVFVICEDGTEIDITHTVKGFVYTAIVGDIPKCELTIIAPEIDGIADENLIVDAGENSWGLIILFIILLSSAVTIMIIGSIYG